jgi:hypothetical protein
MKAHPSKERVNTMKNALTRLFDQTASREIPAQDNSYLGLGDDDINVDVEIMPAGDTVVISSEPRAFEKSRIVIKDTCGS